MTRQQAAWRARAMAAADRLRRWCGRPRDPYPMPADAVMRRADDRLRLSPSDAQEPLFAAAPMQLGRRRGEALATAATFLAWQADGRQRLRALLGLDRPPPPQAEPPQADIVAATDARDLPDGIRRRTLYLRTAPQRDVPVSILWPAAAAGPLPVLIYQPGSGAGVHLAHGEVRRPADIERLATGADIGVQAARRGWLVIAVEQFGFGDRRERQRLPLTPGLATGDAFTIGLLVGRNLVGERVFDLVAVMDWLQAGHLAAAVPAPVDADAVTLFGHSSGGTTAVYAAALDTRFRVCVASGCLGMARQTLARRRNGDGDAIVPGLLLWFEIHDILSLIAPRPLLAVTGRTDHIWPADGMATVLAAAAPAWHALAARPPISRVGAAGHRLYPAESWDMLAEAGWLPGG